MDIVSEKKPELLRAGLFGAIGLAAFLLLALVFALSCGGWLLEEDAAPAFTRGTLFMAAALAAFFAARGRKGGQALLAAASGSVLLLLPLLLALLSPEDAFLEPPFWTGLLSLVLGDLLGLALSLKKGTRRRRRRRR